VIFIGGVKHAGKNFDPALFRFPIKGAQSGEPMKLIGGYNIFRQCLTTAPTGRLLPSG